LAGDSLEAGGRRRHLEPGWGEAHSPQRSDAALDGGEAALDAPPEEPSEPVYERAVLDDAQGNIIPGFNKDHQHFLFLRIAEAQPTSRWLAQIAPRLATMDDVLAFVRAHRSQRFRLGAAEPRLSATWVKPGGLGARYPKAGRRGCGGLVR
jgi:hypothetical protein